LSNACRDKSECASDTLLFVFQAKCFSLEHPNQQESRCIPIFGKNDVIIYVVESIKENIQRTPVVVNRGKRDRHQYNCRAYPSGSKQCQKATEAKMREESIATT